jgi:hypothetical protein
MAFDITIIVSPIGAGKSLLTTKKIIDWCTLIHKKTGAKKIKVAANYKLKNLPDYIDFLFLDGSKEETYDIFKNLTGYIIGLDEIDLWFDNYQHNNKFVKDFRAKLKQVRKSGNQIIGNTQDFSYVNINLRKLSTKIIYVRTAKFGKNVFNMLIDIYRFSFSNNREFFIKSLLYKNMQKYFKYYNTNEILKPLRIPKRFLEKKKKKKEIILKIK